MSEPAEQTPPDAATYPRRGSCYAHRHQRLMAKVCAAQQIGPAAAWLVVVIAHQEDAKRYSGPVTFFNEQLMPILGVASRSSLVRARNRAVEAGWLHYSPGGKGRPGKYWVTTPPDAPALDDSPLDETPPQSPVAAARTVSRTESVRHGEDEPVTEPVLPSTICTASGRKRDGNSAPFDPVPSPEESTGDGSNEPDRQTADLPPTPEERPAAVSPPENLRTAAQPVALRAIRQRQQLEDTAGLVALHQALASDPACPVTGSEHHLQQLVTLAEHCLRPDKPIRRPTAVFAARVRAGDFTGLTLAEEERARKRLKDHSRPQSPAELEPRNPVQVLAAKFGGSTAAEPTPDPWEQADRRRELMRQALEAHDGAGSRPAAAARSRSRLEARLRARTRMRSLQSVARPQRLAATA